MVRVDYGGDKGRVVSICRWWSGWLGWSRGGTFDGGLEIDLTAHTDVA